MELAEEYCYDLSSVTPTGLHSLGHTLFRNGEISFTQYSLLSIPCEESRVGTEGNQPFDAIEYFRKMNTNEMAKGVPDQLNSLIGLLDKLSVKTS